MKNLSDFKKRLVVGQVVEKTYHLPDLIVRGNLMNTVMAVGPTVLRQVVKYPQSKSVGFELLEGPKVGHTTWLEYPKSKDLHIMDKDMAQVWSDDVLILTYRFI